jgi:4-amino-4-deoxy-L-arabinose transferase-like glycosyltransferase
VKSRSFLVATLIVFAAAAFLRGAWLTADPPVRRAVGIVWHDEGAWVHNARNKALWDTWRTDEWNPVFVAPVFTALEYASFATFGVGTWQARVVPALSGLVAVVALMVGLHVLAGSRAAIIGGALLATNYAFVMWNRAALMESTMTAFMVVAWTAWVLSERRAAWGIVAGLAAVAAFFTKAAAAFFIAAMTLDVVLTAWDGWRRATPDRHQLIRQSVFAAAGLTAGAAIAGLLFVLPHWTDYQFYNWQMSVTRKPSYTVGAFIDRATWLPIVQGLFSRMPIELGAGLACLLALVIGWRWARPAERLLVLWVLIGLAELVAHDSGNERRYVMFIPPIIALAALLLVRSSALFAPGRHMTPVMTFTTTALLLPVSYLALGSLLRPFLIDRIEGGDLTLAVRASAAMAVLLTLLFVWQRRRLLHRAATHPIPRRIASGLVAMALAWNLVQWADWAHTRTTHNHDASVAVGTLVPDGTLVQGKLANGMALENRIRPLFVGNHFGNYADRLQRDDARYILTYDLPRIGYESSDGSGLIQGILDHYPARRVVTTFEVDETRMEDRAVLIDKFPDLSPAHARD